MRHCHQNTWPLPVCPSVGKEVAREGQGTGHRRGTLEAPRSGSFQMGAVWGGLTTRIHSPQVTVGGRLWRCLGLLA